MVILGIIISGFILAFMMPILVRSKLHYLPAVFAAIMFAYFINIYQSQNHLQNYQQDIINWLPSVGINITFLYDGLSLAFALLVSFIGILIMIYAAGYMKGHAQIGKFLGYMTAFMVSMIGLVISGDLITMFIFWELTTITSFLLISFNHSKKLARRAAVQALVITGGGGLALLAGLIWLGNEANSWNIIDITNRLNGVFYQHSNYLPILILILIGAFTKSAQVPFNCWLPNAMEAPTPVSAFLHSATMVKAGVFLLMRLNPVLSGGEIWTIVLTTIGGITLITGVVMALAQRDLKQVLAQTTVASLGLLVLLIGLGTQGGIEAAVLYLTAHAFFKGTLFMVVGAIDHETKTRDVTELSGLNKTMPLLAIAALGAGLSMGGLPPFTGFVAKEVMYAATANSGMYHSLITVTILLGNVMMLIAGALIAIYPFMKIRSIGGENLSHPQTHEPPISLLAGPIVLSLAGLIFGIFAGNLNEGLLGDAVRSIGNNDITPKWTVIPHFNIAFLLSIITITMGILGMFKAPILRSIIGQRIQYQWGGDAIYDRLMAKLFSSSRKVIALIQDGNLRSYLAWSFFFVTLAMLLMLWPSFDSLLRARYSDIIIVEVIVLLIIISGALLIATSHSRLRAITSLGLVGFGIAILFMLLGAPDLSFTQFMVETLQVVIMAFVLPFLDLSAKSRRSRKDITRDLIIAVAFGISITWLLIASVETEANYHLSSFFNNNSLVLAHGKNVVNVILVDFRALDTLGEISVVMMAGMAILALMSGFRAIRNNKKTPPDNSASNIKAPDLTQS